MLTHLFPYIRHSEEASKTSSYGGVAQHWALIYSEHRQAGAQRTLNKQWLKHNTQEVKAFMKFFRISFACETDAKQSIQGFKRTLKATYTTNVWERARQELGKLSGCLLTT